MKKFIAIFALVFALPFAAAADCKKRTDPDPGPQRDRPVIEATVAEVCINNLTRVRKPDSWCEEPKVDDAHDWRYPTRDSKFREQPLPALGEKLQEGWGERSAPSGTRPVRIPPEGALFQR